MNNMSKLKIPFFRLAGMDDEIQAVSDVLRSGWLTTGEKASLFERKFAGFVHAKHALAVNSATSALHLALDAIGVKMNDKVVVPVHTFTATAEIARYLSAEIIFVDIDKDTFCLDIDDFERKVEREEDNKIKAVLPVHFAGHPCDMNRIMAVCREKNIKCVEDAAHSLPTIYDPNDGLDDSGKIVGSIGDATCFSFYANKTITTGEGGMLVTDSDDIANRARVMRLHGIDRDVFDRFKSDRPSWYYEVVAPGYKYNITDIAAALGIVQLDKCMDFHKKRAMIAEYYFENLKNIEGLKLPVINCRHYDHAWHLFVILIEPTKGNGMVDRNEFIRQLSLKGIGTSVHYIPLHMQPYYKDRFNLSAEDFPNSTWVYERCVSLPIFQGMLDSEVEYVADSVKKVLKQ